MKFIDYCNIYSTESFLIVMGKFFFLLQDEDVTKRSADFIEAV